MDQQKITTIKNQLRNAKVTQLKADIQSMVKTNTDLISAKDITISTQLELIQTQKDLTENQKLLLNSQPSSNQQQTFTLANITAEERERRRCVVIARFAESSKITPSERIAEDNENVKLLLDEMEIEASVVETFRMGSKKESKKGENAKPRLLKVRLQTSAQVKSFLSNAKNIKNSKTFKNQNILLRKSMTAEERKFEDDLFQKQQARIAELQKLNPHAEYCIYARKICIKRNNQKPEKVHDPLNELNFSKSSSSALQTPIKNSNQNFQSSSPTPRGSN